MSGLERECTRCAVLENPLRKMYPGREVEAMLSLDVLSPHERKALKKATSKFRRGTSRSSRSLLGQVNNALITVGSKFELHETSPERFHLQPREPMAKTDVVAAVLLSRFTQGRLRFFYGNEHDSRVGQLHRVKPWGIKVQHGYGLRNYSWEKLRWLEEAPKNSNWDSIYLRYWIASLDREEAYLCKNCDYIDRFAGGYVELY